MHQSRGRKQGACLLTGLSPTSCSTIAGGVEEEKVPCDSQRVAQGRERTSLQSTQRILRS